MFVKGVRNSNRTTGVGAGAASSGAWSNKLSSTLVAIRFTPSPPALPVGRLADPNRGLGAALGAMDFVPADAPCL